MLKGTVLTLLGYYIAIFQDILKESIGNSEDSR
jgi:hypothetical protein